MAAVSGNAVVVPVEPMQLPVGGGGGNEAPRQWYVDEREVFISWLRGEFAASNAIIDLLLNHLRTCGGESGEYDHVAGCIQQRRIHWSPVLYMQQFFSVADISYALQQVEWSKRQQTPQRYSYGPKEKDGRKFGIGHRYAHRGDGARDVHGVSPVSSTAVSYDGNMCKSEDKLDTYKNTNQKNDAQMSQANYSLGGTEKDGICNTHSSEENSSAKGAESSVEINHIKLDIATGGDTSAVDHRDGKNTTTKQDGSQKSTLVPKEFSAKDINDASMANAVEGLKVYEDFLDSSEITDLLSLANEMRAAGRRGELPGQTLITLKRPMKGHGREIIQLGVSVTEGHLEDENANMSSGEKKIEVFPSILQGVFNRLVQHQVLPTEPDFCIIDFFNEGDHSQPHTWPSWYGRPICNLFLTECDVVYGRVVPSDQRGDYNGSLKLSNIAGSLLVMQGKSADIAKRAIPSLRKQRIVLTFGKSRPKKTLSTEGPVCGSSAVSAVSAPSSIRPPNYSRHPSGRKQYEAIPTTGVLQAPPIRPQTMPPNGVQPIFVAAPVLPYPAPTTPPPATAGWTVAAPPPRHPPAPRLPVPGTGVFLPPGSVHPPPTQLVPVAPVSTEADCAPHTFALPENNGAEKPNAKSDAPAKTSQQNTRSSPVPVLESNGFLSTGNCQPNKEQRIAAAKKPAINLNTNADN